VSDQREDERHSGVSYAPHRRGQNGRLGGVVARARERSVVRLYRGASFTLGHTTTRVSEPAARAVSLGSYLAWRSKRRIVQANAAHILGLPAYDPAVRALARRTYTSYSRFVVELMRLPSRPADEPLRLLPPAGPAHVAFQEVWARCETEGRGLIAASGHIGSIEIFAGSYALQGLPTWGLADDTAYPELFELLNSQRARWGVGIIGWRNLREIYRVLRGAPAALGMVVDWGYRPEDVPVRLFGAWTTLPAGPATLAARTRAIILPVAAYHVPETGGYRNVTAPALEVTDASPRSIAIATQAIADALESFVRAAPEQWHTFKPMWPATEAEERRLEARAMEMLGDDAPPRSRGRDG
jgi:phosphatidylinositol dimannoside acyltransferase